MSSQAPRPQPNILQIVWGYVPNTPLAIVGSAVFKLLALVTLYRLVRRRNWWGLCLPIGAFAYSMGFTLRPFIKHDPNNKGLFIAMQLFTVTSPAAFLAFNYIVYGRFVQNRVGDKFSFVKPGKVATIFVISDVVTFLIQGGGGGLQISKDISTAKLGTNILLAGLILQAISYLFFIVLLAYTHRAVAKIDHPVRREVAWRAMWLLYFSSLFVMVRSIYRVIEFAQGHDGFLVRHEVYFYILDALMLFIATVIYAPFWPGAYVVAPEALPTVDPRQQDSEKV